MQKHGTKWTTRRVLVLEEAEPRRQSVTLFTSEEPCALANSKFSLFCAFPLNGCESTCKHGFGGYKFWQVGKYRTCERRGSIVVLFYLILISTLKGRNYYHLDFHI